MRRRKQVGEESVMLNGVGREVWIGGLHDMILQRAEISTASSFANGICQVLGIIKFARKQCRTQMTFLLTSCATFLESKLQLWV